MSDRIIIVDDHPLFRAALSATLAEGSTAPATEQVADLDALTARLDADPECDLVLLDLDLPGASGLAGLLLLRAQYPALPVLIVSAISDRDVIGRALALGASGYLSKSAGAAEIRSAVAAVLAGEVVVPVGAALGSPLPGDAILRRLSTLTPQQVRVLTLLGKGLMNKQIAHELGISEATVKVHVSAILQKLGVDSRTQAVIAAAALAGQESGTAAQPAAGDA